MLGSSHNIVVFSQSLLDIKLTKASEKRMGKFHNPVTGEWVKFHNGGLH